MFFYKKLLMPRVFIVYVVKVKKGKYKIMYLLKNTYFNENYKGLVIIENEYNDVSFINEKFIGKWVNAELDNYGHILRLFR